MKITAYSNKKDSRFSIRMNKILIEEIKAHAHNAIMTLHDFVFIRCATPQDRKLELDIEYLKRPKK